LSFRDDYRALVAWFFLLVSVVFLVVRPDEKVSWNWFIVFVPLWLLDTLMLVYVANFMVRRHCTSGNDPEGDRRRAKLYFFR
jgi:hypothetical protein